jgi:hypothetical protein
VQTSATQLIAAALSVTCALVQLSILRMLRQRKLASQFSFFNAYTAYSVAMVPIGLLPFFFFCQQYFYIFWTLNTLMMLLEVGVMYEVFVNVLKPYSALIDLGKMLFVWATLFLLVAATLTASVSNAQDTVHVARIVVAVNFLERSVRLVQCGLLLLFFLFERRLGLSWRSYSMSIALGLGACGMATLVSSYISSRAAIPSALLGILGNVVYLAAAAFWAYSFAQREPERRNVLDSPAKLIFQRWNEALQASPFATAQGNLAVASVDSFLPNVERTVERVMARKMVN